MDKLKYKLASPALMWFVVLLGGVVLWQTVPEQRLFDSSRYGAVVLLLGLLNFIYVMAQALRVHKKAPASVHGIDELVTEGAYAVVRHPLYAADIALAWCLFVFFPFTRVLAVAAWLTLVLAFWAAFEERMLEDKFLDDYRQYKRRVPMFVPRLTRRNY